MAHQAPDSAGPTNPAIIKNPKAYDAIKFYALVVLPAIGTLYFTMSQIWGLPAAAQVVGSITAIDTFIGVLTHISNVQYQNSDAAHDGTITFQDTAEKTVLNLQPNIDPVNWIGQKTVTLKVNPPTL